MQLFDILNPNIFRPLTGTTQTLFSDLLMLIWENCRSSTDYGMSKTEMIHLVEDYLAGISFECTDFDSLDQQDDAEGIPSADIHSKALWCIARLRNCGWLEDIEVGYGQDAKMVICAQVVPLAQTFYSIIHPTTVTYSGKLNKAYQLLAAISTENAPYENVLKEVSAAMDELNIALRNLNVSIGTFIDRMTQHKTPQEVLDLFEEYEEEVVVAAYQRFKISDNLFNYREALLEGLDKCQDQYLEALVKDYCKVERCDYSRAVGSIHKMIDKISDDLTLMGELIAEIDKNHITYRQRAVQRAQFMLLTDGTTQGKINSLLRYYAQTLDTQASLFDIDDSPLSRLWRIYPAKVLRRSYLKPPMVSKKATEIEPMKQPDAIDEQELHDAHQALLAYARSAVTMENVNAYAQQILKTQAAVSASALVADAGNDLVKIIALHTYSRSDSRVYELESKEQWINLPGIRFQQFVIKRKV